MSLVTPSHQGTSFAALELLADPAKLQQKIDALKAAEESAREQITLAGPASEILKIRAEIDGLKEQAEAHEQHAREECERLIAEAGDAAANIRAKAEQEKKALLAEAEEKLKKAEAVRSGAQSEAGLVKREKEVVAARKSELDHTAESLQQKAEALEQRVQELEGEKEKLAEVRELIHKVL